MKTPIFFVSDNHFQKLKSEFEHKRRKKFYSLLNHIADKKDINKWRSSKSLSKVNISTLPNYVKENIDKFRDWID